MSVGVEGRLKGSIERKTQVTFILVTLFVVLIGFFAYRNTLNSVNNNQTVLHIRQILDALHETLTASLDLQNNQLNYLLAGDAVYAERIAAGRQRITDALVILTDLIGDDADQQERINRLNVAVPEWLDRTDELVATEREFGIEAARTRTATNPSVPLGVEIRGILDAMTEVEQNNWAQQRVEQSTQREQTTLATFVILTAIMIGLLAYGYRLIRRDLAGRQHFEKLLAEERTLLRTVMDTLPNSIYVKDAQLRFVLANRTQALLLGAATPDALVGKSDADFFPAALATQYAADERDIFQSGQPMVNREEPTLSAAGEEKTMLSTKVPLRNERGEIYQLVGISHDITERKRAEQEIQLLNESLSRQAAQLEAANKELEAFSYSVSHDLRAPLRAIDGFSRILLEEYKSGIPPEAERYLLKVRANAQRMGELVDDLLHFSRLSRQPLMKQIVKPNEIVKVVLEEDLRGDRENRDITIKVGELPEVEADPQLLRQLYANLLGNAIKFTAKRDDAQIEVGAERENGAVTYYVKDNGAGFDPQYVHKLFGVFQRLHRAEDFSGTGVGLAIVQRVVVRHGGRVWAEGGVNQGAAFHFTLGEKHGA
jgi:PAS domain S-box-containing protein